MAFKITDECISCGACVANCPAGAIEENGAAFVITDACIECGACQAGCPAGAIVEE